ncbi:Unknown protein [Striga hermonthica]|uniref:Replication factor A C-terminal domain-containing protein n=1 Tax=Striga hermonthica TaxID=68872 RepID=A0A9N7MX40_STRHE|nr:Unknown protein [Striga hermonthica]
MHLCRTKPWSDEIDDLKTGDVVVTSVYSLYEIEETPGIWVCATIETVIDDWCYLACRRCSGKMENIDDQVECTKCKATIGIYRIRFCICDDTANATFILWDRECERIIGRPCHLLKSAFAEQNAMNFELPKEVSNLAGKTMLFKVRIQPEKADTYRAAFSVIRVVIDDNLVSKYKHWDVPIEESDFMTLLLREDNDNGEDAAIEDEITSPMKVVQQVYSVGESSSVKRKLWEELDEEEEEMVVFADSTPINKGRAKDFDESTPINKGKAKVFDE